MHLCYIIDDEQHAVDALVKYIEKTPGLKLAGFQTDPLLALEELRNIQMPDILFLDIDMPDISGLEVAEILGERTYVIFTTAFPNFAVKAFELNVSDFLLKPISFERFTKSTNKIKQVIDLQKKYIPLKEEDHIYINPGVKGKIVPIALVDIVYIKALDNYIMIYTKQGHIITYLTMKDIMSTLPEHKFLRIHRSYIVNLNEIKLIDGNQVILNNQVNLPFGVSYKDEFMNKIALKTIRHKKNS